MRPFDSAISLNDRSVMVWCIELPSDPLDHAGLDGQLLRQAGNKGCTVGEPMSPGELAPRDDFTDDGADGQRGNSLDPVQSTGSCGGTEEIGYRSPCR